MSPRMYHNHLASYEAKKVALYLALIEERAMVGCNLLIQEMHLDPSVEKHPITKCLESTFSMQFE